MKKSNKKLVFYIRDKETEKKANLNMSTPLWQQKLMRDKNSRKR